MAWGLDTDAETLIATTSARVLVPDELRSLADRVSCPVLVIHGTADAIRTRTSRSRISRSPRRHDGVA